MNTGWIPPDQRTDEQLRLTEAFHRQAGTYQSIGAPMVSADDLPELVYLPALEVKATGKLQPRVWQQTGSCVGSGANRAYMHAICGDIVVRGDREEPKTLFPFATYGVGRRKAGMNRPGDGSFGAAQAWSAENFGTLALVEPELPDLPLPQVRNDNWMVWPARTETQWSHPSAWPIPESKVTAEANKHQLLKVTKITSIEELQSLLANGYGCTVASMFGSRGMSVKNGVLIGDWNGSWAHQMTIEGYWQHGQNGLIFFIGNQWGPSAHPECPFQTGKHGVRGNFAVTQGTVERMLRSEVYGHSATEGWPLKELDWDEFVWKIDLGLEDS